MNLVLFNEINQISAGQNAHLYEKMLLYCVKQRNKPSDLHFS